MQLILTFVALFIIFPALSFGSTYYIDYGAANDSANGTAKETPWKRCPGMVGFAGSYTHDDVNGDTFVFKGGVTWPYISGGYILAVQNSGVSAGKEDIYTRDVTWYTGGAWDYPVFDGGPPAPAATINGIQTFTGTNPKSNIIIEYLKIINTRDTDTGSGMGISSSYGGSNVHIRYNYLDTNSINAFEYNPGAGTFSELYFHHNTIRRTGRVYVVLGDARLSNAYFYDNTMEGPWDYDPCGTTRTQPNCYHTDGFFFGGDGISDYAIQNLYVYNNKFWGDWQKGSTALIYVSGTADGSLKGCKNVLIYNNLLVPSNITGEGAGEANGIIIKWGHDTVGVYNNTIDWHSLTNKGGYGVEYYEYVSNITVKNNIINGFDNAIGFETITGTNVMDNNIMYGNTHLVYDHTNDNRCDTIAACAATILNGGIGSTVFPNTFNSVADPKFTTPITPADNDDVGYAVTNGDFSLQATSPAINMGANLSGTFTTDYAANTRGLSWDIGAYEYGGGGPAVGGITLGTGGTATLGSGGTMVLQ